MLLSWSVWAFALDTLVEYIDWAELQPEEHTMFFGRWPCLNRVFFLMRTRLVLFQVGCCIKILLLFYVVSSYLIFASDTKRHKSLATAMNLSRFVQALQDTAVGVWRTKSSMQRTRPELQRAQRVFSIHMGRFSGRFSGRYVKISGLLKAIWGLNRHHPVRLVRFTAAICSKVQETNLTSLKQVTCPGVGSQCLEKTWSRFKSEMFQTHVNSAWNQAWMQRHCGRWKMWISLSFAHQTLWSKLQQAAWIHRVLERLGACNCDAEWPGGSRCVVAPRATLA